MSLSTQCVNLEVRAMVKENKEKIRENAEKLSQMNYFQLLLVKTFQDGLIAGRKIEQEELNKQEA